MGTARAVIISSPAYAPFCGLIEHGQGRDFCAGDGGKEKLVQDFVQSQIVPLGCPSATVADEHLGCRAINRNIESPVLGAVPFRRPDFTEVVLKLAVYSSLFAHHNFYFL